MRFLKLSRIHFVGIGGVGMSGLAELLLSYPLAISGCDARRSGSRSTPATIRPTSSAPTSS